MFHCRLVIINQVFARTLINFGFKRINVKVLVFRVNVLLDTNTKILMITELRN